jgi:hypothetical protein
VISLSVHLGMLVLKLADYCELRPNSRFDKMEKQCRVHVGKSVQE